MQFNATLKCSPADIILVSVFLSKSSAKETRSQMRGWTERRRKKKRQNKKCADVSALCWFKRWASSLSIRIHINIHTVLPESNPVVVLRKLIPVILLFIAQWKWKPQKLLILTAHSLNVLTFFLKAFYANNKKLFYFTRVLWCAKTKSACHIKHCRRIAVM